MLEEKREFFYMRKQWFVLDLFKKFKSSRNMKSSHHVVETIRRNGYHIETMNEGSTKYLYITSIIYGKKLIMEKLLSFSYGLYHTNIKLIEAYVVMNQKFKDPKTFVLWHDSWVTLGPQRCG